MEEGGVLIARVFFSGATAAAAAAPIAFVPPGEPAAADMFVVQDALEKASPIRGKAHFFSSPEAFVDGLLCADPSVVGVGHTFARKLDSVNVIVVSGHGVVLQSGAAESFEQAKQIVALNPGSTCISTGDGGFCVLFRQPTFTACSSGQEQQQQQLQLQELKDRFSCVIGPVTNTYLHAHPTTKLWPRIVDDEHHNGGDGESSHQKDQATHDTIRQFWINVLSRVPTHIDGVDLDARQPQPQPQPELLEAAEPRQKKGKKGKKGKKTPDVHVIDTFDDVHEIIASTLDVQTTRILDGKPGNVVVVAALQGPVADFECPMCHARDGNVGCRLNRLTGEYAFLCTSQECFQADYPWEGHHIEGSISSDPIYPLLNDMLKDQVELVTEIADEVRNTLVFDATLTGDIKWRVFDPEWGTWKLCISHSTPKGIVYTILKSRLRAIEVKAVEAQKVLPAGSEARGAAIALIELVQQTIASKCGSVFFLGQLVSMLEARVCVDRDMWNSHFSGYMPVANMLLRFCSKSGTVEALEYRPDQYVRQEYQSKFTVYDPDAPMHGPTEALIASWWSEEEQRRSWMQFLVYALSRCAFAEKIFVMYGPPGSGKSALVDVLAHWFNSNYIFVLPGASLIIQKPNVSNSRDDDGQGHNSTMLSLCDKALVLLPEPPVGGVFRDDVVKRLTGDKQGGRRAHSFEVLNFDRTHTLATPCNFIPRPANSGDSGMWSRLELVVSTRVFYRNEAHKKMLMAKMPKGQVCDWIACDSNVVKEVKESPAGATYFLNLLIADWTRLIVTQKRAFVSCPRACAILKEFSESLSAADSVVTFLSQQVKFVSGDAVLPKVSLYVAYKAWHAAYGATNGSPGPLVSEDSFKKKAMLFFESKVTSVQRSVPIMEMRDSRPVFSAPKKQVHCYLGIALKSHDSYPSLQAAASGDTTATTTTTQRQEADPKEN